MRAYRIATGRSILPFGDGVRDLYIGVDPLGRWQERAVRACGLELVDVASFEEIEERPCFAFYDDVFFSEMALRQLVADAMRTQEDLQLAIPSSAILAALGPLQGALPVDGGSAFDVFFLVSREALSENALRSRAKPRLLTAFERTRQVRLPPLVVGGEARAKHGAEVSAPVTARVVAHVRHWIHLLRLSQLSIGVTLLDGLRKRPGLVMRLRLMRRRDPWEIARKVCFIDPTARVHPTADLECAVIGPGAVVGAHAHVHRSVLGEGVQIGDHAVVVGSTFADGVQVLRSSYFALCASMPGSTLSSAKTQLSLFGREAFLTTSALLIDAKLRGEVHVVHEGRLVSAGSSFLGACLGHRVTLGAQVVVRAGRAIDNGAVIVGSPDLQVSESTPYPEGTVLTVRDGKLVPLPGRGIGGPEVGQPPDLSGFRK